MDESNFNPDDKPNTKDNQAPRGENLELARLFNRTGTLMHRYYRLRLHSQMHDPNRGQGRVLSILRLKPEISQKDLAYLLDMRNQSLGELLAKLERAGYITRAASEDDRRAMNIRLTESGKTAAEQAEKNQETGGRLFDCISAEEQAQLAGILKKLISAMENELEDEYGEFWEEARRHRHEIHRHGEHVRDEMHDHMHDMEDHLREHGRMFHHHMRGLRRDGMFWEDGWGGRQHPEGRPGDGFTDENPWNDEGRGNGPREQ